MRSLAGARPARQTHETAGHPSSNQGAQNKKPPSKLGGFCLDLTRKSGRGERIRTSGLYVPNVALYQAKLHPDVYCRLDLD